MPSLLSSVIVSGRAVALISPTSNFVPDSALIVTLPSVAVRDAVDLLPPPPHAPSARAPTATSTTISNRRIIGARLASDPHPRPDRRRSQEAASCSIGTGAANPVGNLAPHADRPS